MIDGDPPGGRAKEDDIDGCDFEFDESEATPDAELPVAAGGVQVSNEEEIDACDVDFTDAEPTTDAELPLAVGGVS
jgi:hypothetical protein